MKRLGPELKLSDLKKLRQLKPGQFKASDVKVPPFLVDLYWDLWDRRLLPLIVVVVVAIAAVPFVLGGGSSKPPSPASSSLTLSELSGEPAASTMTVVQAEPGLRDYHRRLGYLTPTDPFKQHEVSRSHIAHLNPMPSSHSTTTTTTSTSSTSTATSSNSPTSTPEPQPSPPATSPPTESGEESSESSTKSGGGSSGSGTAQHITLFEYAIDVKITRVDPQSEGNPPPPSKKADSNQQPQTSIKHQVEPLTKLPGDKAPVVTYMGVSKKGKPLLLVSRDVKSIFGETKCLEGDEICQLVEVEPGFPVVFVYGGNEVRYRITVLKVEPVAIAHK